MTKKLDSNHIIQDFLIKVFVFDVSDSKNFLLSIQLKNFIKRNTEAYGRFEHSRVVSDLKLTQPRLFKCFESYQIGQFYNQL